MTKSEIKAKLKKHKDKVKELKKKLKDLKADEKQIGFRYSKRNQ